MNLALQFVDFNSITNVLDIGSNRGAFIRYLDDGILGKILLVLADPSVIDSYKSMITFTFLIHASKILYYPILF